MRSSCDAQEGTSTSIPLNTAKERQNKGLAGRSDKDLGDMQRERSARVRQGGAQKLSMEERRERAGRALEEQKVRKRGGRGGGTWERGGRARGAGRGAGERCKRGWNGAGRGGPKRILFTADPTVSHTLTQVTRPNDMPTRGEDNEYPPGGVLEQRWSRILGRSRPPPVPERPYCPRQGGPFLRCPLCLA